MHGLPIALSLKGPTEANVLSNCGILQETFKLWTLKNPGGNLTCIQALCEQYANDPPKRTEPSVLRMSPVSPWSSDVFPEPTAPTIARSFPRGTLKSICFNLNKVSSLTSFGSDFGSGLDVMRRFFFVPFCSLPSSGGGLSQVKDPFSTSRAYLNSGS